MFAEGKYLAPFEVMREEICEIVKIYTYKYRVLFKRIVICNIAS